MNKSGKKLVIIATHAEENPGKATLPFVIGSSGLAMDVEVVIILQIAAVYLAVKGYADDIHAPEFAPLNELLDIFLDGGGGLMVCSPCIQARNIDSEKLKFLDKIPYALLVIAAVFLLLAPFRPMPHVLEKLMMLKNGTLTRPIDIFDLIFHLIPTILLAIKAYRDLKSKG
jgi:uncharacterized protein involved in oxidation of intracellular sulfur